MYHLTLTENQTRTRVLLQQLRQARRDPRRWLRLADVEKVLAKTNDPDSFRALLLVTTHLEDIIENDREMAYPLWSVMRLPYVITDGPGRKCTAAEMIDAPVWNSELNWMSVLGHLTKLIPTLRECAINDRPGKADIVNARIESELAPLLFEMNAVAPVLVGEVETLLDQGSTALADHRKQLKQSMADQQVIEQTVAPRQRSSPQSASIDRPALPDVALKADDSGAEDQSSVQPEFVPPAAAASDRKNAMARKNAKAAKQAKANSKRRALAVGIAETENTASDQHAYQLVLPMFA